MSNNGNINFRTKTRERVIRYMASSRRKHKDAVAREVLNLIKDQGGRFLRQATEDEKKAAGYPVSKTAWIEAVERKSIEKIKQAYRDIATSRQESSAAAGAGSSSDSGIVVHEVGPSDSSTEVRLCHHSNASQRTGKTNDHEYSVVRTPFHEHPSTAAQKIQDTALQALLLIHSKQHGQTQGQTQPAVSNLTVHQSRQLPRALKTPTRVLLEAMYRRLVQEERTREQAALERQQHALRSAQAYQQNQPIIIDSIVSQLLGQAGLIQVHEDTSSYPDSQREINDGRFGDSKPAAK